MKGRNRGLATAGARVSHGEFGLKSTDWGNITSRQIEAARKGSSRNAPMQVLLFTLVRLTAFNRQKILLAGDRDLVGGKSGDRYRDAIGVRAGPHNIVRRVTTLIFGQLGIVQKIEQVVEANA